MTFGSLSRLIRRMPPNLLKNLAPPVCRGSKVLDKSAFTIKFNVWAVLFTDPKHIGQFLKSYHKEAISIPRIPFIDCLDRESPEGKELLLLDIKNRALKVIILNDKLKVTKKDEEKEPKNIKYIPENLTDSISKECINFINDADGIYRIHELTFGYDFWKAEEILKAILPEDLLDDIPTSFTKAGHLAHLNLRDEYKPYDSVIGQVILDKNPTITTVVDKVDTVGNKFRTFKMKVIAGEPDFMVTQRESGCDFTFDFSKVYWNSRLSTEHGRLIKGFKSGSAICDVMAGVGPFAIPAGKKGCFVFANDLNPESYKYLKQNIESNKATRTVLPFNLDGAQLIKDSPKMLMDYVKEHPTVKIISHPNGHAKRRKVSELKVPHFFSEYAMNLPGSAITFVPAYVGLFSRAFPDLSKEEIQKLPDYKLPLIHVYHFEKFSPMEKPEPSEDDLFRRMHKKISNYLNYNIPFEKLSFHLVRKVAPTKPMYCITFELPEEVAFSK